MDSTRCPLSVLVVDDCPDTAHSLCQVFCLCGHLARAAVSGEEALRLASAEPPDAVVLDLWMPEMDGWELCRRLTSAAKPPLVIAITGSQSDEDKRRSAAAGVHLHLVKPVEPAVVLGVLERFARAVSPTDFHVVRQPAAEAEGTLNPSPSPASPSDARDW